MRDTIFIVPVTLRSGGKALYKVRARNKASALASARAEAFIKRANKPRVYRSGLGSVGGYSLDDTPIRYSSFDDGGTQPVDYGPTQSARMQANRIGRARR